MKNDPIRLPGRIYQPVPDRVLPADGFQFIEPVNTFPLKDEIRRFDTLRVRQKIDGIIERNGLTRRIQKMLQIRTHRPKRGINAVFEQMEFSVTGDFRQSLPERLPLLVPQARNQSVQTVFHSHSVSTKIVLRLRKSKPFCNSANGYWRNEYRPRPGRG